MDEVAFREDVLDHLRSLRTGLALVAVLAAAALGIAVYALVDESDEDDSGRRGASQTRVSRLDDRVDRLE